MGDRLLRAVEKWLTPWFDRAAEERRARVAAAAVRREEEKTAQTERRRKAAIASRIEAEHVLGRPLGSYSRVRIGR